MREKSEDRKQEESTLAQERRGRPENDPSDIISENTGSIPRSRPYFLMSNHGHTFSGQRRRSPKARDTATASLIIIIIIEKLDKITPDPNHTRLEVSAPLGALMALGWDRRAVAFMGSGAYIHTMQKLRQSKLPKQRYADLENKLKTAWADETAPLPDLWELWRALLAEFHLHDHAPFSAWTALIENLQTEGNHSPVHLTDRTLEKVRNKHGLGAIPDMPQILRHAAKRQITNIIPLQALSITCPPNVETLLDQIRAKNIDDTKVAQQKAALLGESETLLTSPAPLLATRRIGYLTRHPPPYFWASSSRREGISTCSEPHRARFDPWPRAFAVTPTSALPATGRGSRQPRPP